jgi:hypothetical protein
MITDWQNPSSQQACMTPHKSSYITGTHGYTSIHCPRLQLATPTSLSRRAGPTPPHTPSLLSKHTHPTPATTTSHSTGCWINTPWCQHLNVPHNTNRQLPESSEHQILWFYVIPSLVITDNLITTFNQDFNNRNRYQMSPTPKWSDQCSIS